jgi:hypothetical protein
MQARHTALLKDLEESTSRKLNRVEDNVGIRIGEIDDKMETVLAYLRNLTREQDQAAEQNRNAATDQVPRSITTNQSGDESAESMTARARQDGNRSFDTEFMQTRAVESENVTQRHRGSPRSSFPSFFDSRRPFSPPATQRRSNLSTGSLSPSIDTFRGHQVNLETVHEGGSTTHGSTKHSQASHHPSNHEGSVGSRASGASRGSRDPPPRRSPPPSFNNGISSRRTPVLGTPHPRRPPLAGEFGSETSAFDAARQRNATESRRIFVGLTPLDDETRGPIFEK